MAKFSANALSQNSLLPACTRSMQVKVADILYCVKTLRPSYSIEVWSLTPMGQLGWIAPQDMSAVVATQVAPCTFELSTPHHCPLIFWVGQLVYFLLFGLLCVIPTQVGESMAAHSVGFTSLLVATLSALKSNLVGGSNRQASQLIAAVPRQVWPCISSRGVGQDTNGCMPQIGCIKWRRCGLSEMCYRGRSPSPQGECL